MVARDLTVAASSSSSSRPCSASPRRSPRAGVQSAGIRTARWPVFLIGLAVIILGMALRRWPSSPWPVLYGPGSGAQWSNGRRHRPYRFVRHPSYTAIIMSFVGIGSRWKLAVTRGHHRRTDDRTDHSDSCRRARPTQRARRAVPRVLPESCSNHSQGVVSGFGVVGFASSRSQCGAPRESNLRARFRRPMLSRPILLTMARQEPIAKVARASNTKRGWATSC